MAETAAQHPGRHSECGEHGAGDDAQRRPVHAGDASEEIDDEENDDVLIQALYGVGSAGLEFLRFELIELGTVGLARTGEANDVVLTFG